MSSPPASRPVLVKAPVVFVTGKGGVGKTTVAAALALMAKREGLRAALVEFDDGQAGARALGSQGQDVTHLVLSYDKALVETLGGVLGTRILAKAIVSQRAIRRLIRAVPALREFAFLDRIRTLLADNRFDRVVVDLPSSGHALDWLRVPHAFDRFLGMSPLGSMGRRIHEQLVAPGRSDVVIVTLAEPLVVKETEELCRRMREELSIAPALVVVNRTVKSDPEGAWDAARLLASEPGELSQAAGDVLEILTARADQAEDTSYAFGLARALDAARVVSLPETAHDPPVTQVADWLAEGEAA